MRYGRLCTLACVAALASVACGESRTIDDADAAIVIDLDGAMIDAGVDGGPPANVGAACAADTECTGEAALCLQSAAFPDGYCSRACADGEACPEGSECVQLGRTQSYCMDLCDPAATARECRAGYGCTSADPRLPTPFCFGGCEADSDCPEGLLCDPNGGQIGEGNCYDPSSSVGDACTDESSCPMGAFCFAEAFGGWPGGACIGLECDPETNTGCGEGQHCVESTGAGGICLAACTDGTQCRAEYACEPVAAHPDRSICQPACESDAECSEGRVCNVAIGTCDEPFAAGQLGDACSRWSGGCTGGSCFSEFDTGYPGAYCAYEGCTLGDDSTCPDGGVCVAPSVEGEPNACHRGCAFSTDCDRPGYVCRDVDGDGPLTGTACMPQCTADSDCVNDGFVCELVSGLCREG